MVNLKYTHTIDTLENNNLEKYELKKVEEKYNNLVAIEMLISDLKANNQELQWTYFWIFDKFKNMNLIQLTAKKNELKKEILEEIKIFLKNNNLENLYEIILKDFKEDNFKNLQKILELKNLDELKKFSNRKELEKNINNFKNKFFSKIENMQIEDFLAFLLFLYFKNL